MFAVSFIEQNCIQSVNTMQTESMSEVSFLEQNCIRSVNVECVCMFEVIPRCPAG